MSVSTRRRRSGYSPLVRGPLPLASTPRALGSVRLAPGLASSIAAPVTFPSTRLQCKVLIALGADLTQPWYTWSWTDITQWVRFESGISTTQGRQDETSVVQYGRGQLTLDNRDGRFSRRNPNGPYYGLLSINTPIWGTVDAGSGAFSRLQQFVVEWPTRWDISGKDSTVPIQTAGALRRLGQIDIAKSALRRSILPTTPLAYWPCEDGTSATQVASGLASGSPMTGTPVFGSSFGGSSGSIDLAAIPDGALSATVNLPDANGFQVEFAVETSGFAAVLLMSCGTVAPYLYNSKDGINPPPDALPHHVAYRFVQAAGPSVLITLWYDGVLQYADVAIGGQTLSSVLNLTVVNRDGITAGALGHIAVYSFSDVSSPVTRAGAATGYNGESPVTRIVRVAAEQGVAMVCTGSTQPSPAMGPQPVAKFLDVLRDAEAVDQGILYETDWGLGYVPLADRTNVSASLALDFDQRHIAATPEPADDDQRLRNRWTASRPGGSFAIVEQTTGPNGTGSAGPGIYEDSVTANVQLDSQLRDQAGWRRSLGVVDEDRWPSIPIRLHATPDLIPSWAAMPFGGRVTAANPPSQVAPDTIDAIREGWSERWDPFTWVAELNTSPYTPYRVGTLAADVGDTAETTLILTPDTLTLAADVSTTDVTWSINSSPIWTVAAESFPRYIWWEGEVVRLDVCTGASAPQTWTVVRSINGVSKAHLANSTGRIYRPGVLTLS